MRTDRETAVFVRRGEDFLILHRTVDRYWHVVAGVVERDETFAAAAARELREETGLDAPLRDLELAQSYRIPDDLRDEYESGIDEVIVESFLATAPESWEPELNEEHDDYRWCSLADAIALAHWPETAEVLAQLASRKAES